MDSQSALVFVNQTFSSCLDCINFLGKQLEENQIVTPEYTKSIINSHKSCPGIIVFDDGIAVAHTPPGQGVLKDGIVFISLAQDLDFENSDFQPVRFVIGIASSNYDNHYQTVCKVVKLVDAEIQFKSFNQQQELQDFIQQASR